MGWQVLALKKENLKLLPKHKIYKKLIIEQLLYESQMNSLTI